MSKRFFSLLLAMLMLCSFVLTSCSSNEEEDDATATTVRSATYLTLYAITEKGTTEDAIKLVQNELNKYTSSLKTELVLRFYTEDKYEKALDDMFALFKEEADAAEVKKAEEAAAKKEQLAYEKTLSDEERRKLNQEKRLAQKEAERLAAQEEKERLERIEQGLEEPPEPITGAQMDVLYINGYDHYMSLIAGNDYFPGKNMLAPLDEYLKRDEKLITNYVNSVILNTAKVNGATYGIPVNKSVGKAQYFVYNTKLLEKYELDVSNIKTLFSLDDTLAMIKEKEPNVITMMGPVGIAGSDFYGEEGSAITVTNPEQGLFTAEVATFTYGTYAMKSHFERMANYRAAGYFKESFGSNVKDFFLDIREGTVADAEKWREEGYTVTIYTSPKAESNETLSGLFGISSMSKIQDRAAEILTLIYTNPNFATTLRYGVENVHYTLNEDGYVEVISKDYAMDFFKTGNSFIGKVTEDRAGYREAGIANNLMLKPHGFMGFAPKFEKEQADILAKANKLVKGKYQELCKGVDNWEEIYSDLNSQVAALGFTLFLGDVFNAAYSGSATALIAYDASRKVEKPEYFKTVEGEEGTEVTE